MKSYTFGNTVLKENSTDIATELNESVVAKDTKNDESEKISYSDYGHQIQTIKES